MESVTAVITPWSRKVTRQSRAPSGRSRGIGVGGRRTTRASGLTATRSRAIFEGEEKAKVMSAAPLPAEAPTPSLAERKRALEELLRARRLQAEAPPLRGESRRLPSRPASARWTRSSEGGFPRGALSEVHGPASSGRTGVLLGAARAGDARRGARRPRRSARPFRPRFRRRGRDGPRATSLAARPAARVRGGATRRRSPTPRRRWRRSRSSGLFDVVALDLAGASRERRRLPTTTWLRLQRLVEDAPRRSSSWRRSTWPAAPAGAALALEPVAPRWSGPPGPARLLAALAARARAGRHGLRGADFAFAAL